MFNRRSLLRIQGRGVLSGSNRVAISRWRNQAWNRLRSTDPHQGFNGAAISRSRNRTTKQRSDYAGAALQWGRDLSIAESWARRRNSSSRNQLQWGRDLSIAESHLHLHLQRQSKKSFNGAAISRSRNQPRRRGSVGRLRASMGPRSLDRGITAGAVRSVRSSVTLQWGRDLSIAESSRPRRWARKRS